MLIHKSTEGLYEDYRTKMQKMADLRSAIAVLGWDQETYLPIKGAALRGRQTTTLSVLLHSMSMDPELEILLERLRDLESLDPVQKKNIQLSLEDVKKAKKYPPSFVEQLSETSSRAYHAWIQARRENRYEVLEPILARMVELKKQESGLLGFEAHPYDALLNEHEKGMTTALLDSLFSRVSQDLSPLIRRIAAKPQPEDHFLHQHFDRDKQWQFGIKLLREMGFDFDAGRQDISEHPFTTSFGNLDVRITTRIDEQDFGNMTWSCLHEGGHALYEQGLDGEAYGLPSGEAASLAVHESQSRLWENCIGRSYPYWNSHFRELVSLFPENFRDTPFQIFYRGINRVHPSLIRTEADELTYHFHIMIRYEIEKELIAGNVSTPELRELWNDQYASRLGVTVPDDLHGILQDIHWSHGSFGYFPTYSVGSFLAAQFFSQASKDIGGLTEQISQGRMDGLLGWLRKNIHQKGRLFTSRELCKMVTGEELDFKHFLNYAERKYGEIYTLN